MQREGTFMHDQWTNAELASLRGQAAFTRREILVTSLAAGFALATQPVSAQTITTDAAGLTAGEVKIPVADGEIPGYRAMPDHGRRFPVVLVVQEIFGVHEHIRDLCRRFAKVGYLAVAPELYARQGDVSKIADWKQIFAEVVAKVPDTQVMSDLDATLAWAGKSSSGEVKRAAITGFCWGGRIVWLYAAHNPRLRAGVAWYGRLTGDKSELQPRYPLDVAAELKAPVLGLYGGKDQGIPPGDIDKMRAALSAARQPSQIVVFPEAPHGFLADYRPSYRPVEAADAWAQCLAWFRSNGVG
jgi:carboxymethylenebutenolidase